MRYGSIVRHSSAYRSYRAPFYRWLAYRKHGPISESHPRSIQHDRSKLRYPMGADRAVDPTGKEGRQQADYRRAGHEINGVTYILSTGCQLAALPKDLPPRSTVDDYLRRLDDDRTLDRIHHALYVKSRELAGREASPTAAIIDSQSVKSAEKRLCCFDVSDMERDASRLARCHHLRRLRP